MVSSDISRVWTQFFSNNREQLARVTVGTGTRFVNLVVSITQHLSQTGNLIQIVGERDASEAALTRAKQG
jgi:hypothetical protein